nr:uncharacterized protein LOC128688329 isoform X1 [Cherax quadricarinatus]
MPFTQTHAPFLTKTLLGPINTMYIFLDNTVGDVAISGSLSANFTPPYLDTGMGGKTDQECNYTTTTIHVMLSLNILPMRYLVKEPTKTHQARPTGCNTPSDIL